MVLAFKSATKHEKRKETWNCSFMSDSFLYIKRAIKIITKNNIKHMLLVCFIELFNIRDTWEKNDNYSLIEKKGIIKYLIYNHYF